MVMRERLSSSIDGEMPPEKAVLPGGRPSIAPASGSLSGPAAAARGAVREILDRLPNGVLAADVETGRFLYANPAICRMLGHSMEELREMTPADLHPVLAVPRVIAQFEKALHGESEGIDDVLLRRKDGRELSVNVHNALVELDGRSCLLEVMTDISGRKRAEDALHESDARLQAILHNIRDVVWSLSYPDFLHLFVSVSAESLFGQAPEAFRSNPGLWTELLHPDDRATLDQLKRDLADRGYAYRECRIIRPDGALRWVADRCKLAYDEDGRPCRVDGVSCDITERKRSEKQLTALAAAVEQSNDLMVVKDLDLRVVAANTAYARAQGQETPWDLIGKADGAIPDPASSAGAAPARTQDELRALRLSPGEMLLREEEMAMATGQVRHVLTKTYPVFDPNRNRLGIGAVSTDITSLKHSENALRESERKLRSIFQSMTDVVFVMDRQGRYIEIAPTHTSLLYRPPQELVGKTAREVFPSHLADLCLNTIDRALATGSSIPLDYQLEIAGTPLWFSAMVTPLTDDSVVWVARDITDRKRAEQQMLQNEMKYRALVEQAHDIVYSLTPEGVVTYVSPSWTRLLGHSVEDIVGHSFDVVVHPDDLRQCRDAIRQAIETDEQKADAEYRVRHRDGSYRWHVTHASVIRDADGHVASFAAIARDITERKRAEEALRESEARYDQLAEQSRTMAWEVDADGLYTFVSPVSQTVLGYTPEELVGRMHYYDVHPSDGREAFRALTTEAFRKKESLRGLVNPAVAKNGRIVWLSTDGIPMLDADGNLRGYRGSDTDITERKLAEDALLESKERFEQLAEQSRTIAWEIDSEGLYTYVSRAVQIVLGLRPEDIVGKVHFYEGHPPEGREKFKVQAFELLRRKQPFAGLVNPTVAKDGRIVWLSTDGIPMLDADGRLRGYRGSGTDVTERKLAEDEIRQMSLRMRDLTRHIQAVREEEKRRISVWLHDEIGQMLTRARMDAMLLEQDASQAPGEAAAALGSLKRTLDQAVKTIRNISTDLRPSILDDFGLVAVLEWAVHEDEKRLKIPFHLQIDNVPDFLDADLSVAFYRIARECLTNIARHAQATAVDIRLSCDRQCLTLVVKDNGRGMPPETAESPTAFGLGQMRERASALGGEVRIESRPGEGTTVVATVPVQRSRPGGDLP